MKALLATSEIDDSRPIVMSQTPKIPGFVSVLGSKIDNVYDILKATEAVLSGGGA
jgi:hypothetical protein